MANYIYKRISTNKQSLERQDVAIKDYCNQNNIDVPEENIYADVITGKTIKREQYQTMKSKLAKDDILILLDLDRLGRNWNLIKQEWEELTNKGIYIIVVNCPIINTLPDSSGEITIDKRLIQNIMFSLLCYLSQKEVEKISQRTKEALQAKKAQGVVLGRPETIAKETKAKVIDLYRRGYKYREIAEQTNVSLGTVANIVKKIGKGVKANG